MPDIFISYSHKDTEFVKQLREELNKTEHRDIWVDWEDIPISHPNWWTSIKEGVDSSHSVVLAISPNWMTSLVCNLELKYAIEQNKRIIPLIYKPHELSESQILAELETTEQNAETLERYGKLDIPAMVNENTRQINHINWLLHEDDIQQTAEHLAEIVKTNLNYVQLHTRYLMRAQEWSGSKDELLFGEQIDEAETWLKEGEKYVAQQDEDNVKIVNPAPLNIHRSFIKASREAQIRRKRIGQSAGVVVIALVVGLLIGVVMVLNISGQVNTLNDELTSVEQQIVERNAELNEQFIDIAPTITDIEIARAYCVVGILTDVVERDSVIEICTHMVELAPAIEQAFYRDFRGIAYAQAGLLNEAWRDFDAAQTHYQINTVNCDEILQLRDNWISDLRNEVNPFVADGELVMSTAIQDWLNEPSIIGNSCN